MIPIIPLLTYEKNNVNLKINKSSEMLFPLTIKVGLFII